MGITCIGQMILPSIKLVSSFDVEKPSDSVILEVSLPSNRIGRWIHWVEAVNCSYSLFIRAMEDENCAFSSFHVSRFPRFVDSCAVDSLSVALNPSNSLFSLSIAPIECSLYFVPLFPRFHLDPVLPSSQQLVLLVWLSSCLFPVSPFI